MASLVDKEKALLMPSGTMANLVAGLAADSSHSADEAIVLL